jgi:hypothetical protein
MSGTWNVRSLNRAVASEMAKYNQDLVTVQKRPDETRMIAKKKNDYTFHYENGNVNHHLGTGFFVHKGIIIRNLEFISDRMPYIRLKRSLM